ncbi:hypothetical protein [Mucilaginibacter sp. CSA2-8R]|uniref:hypothetical protein n=1 Tax=Mucilaginibacter sp. CSA2-8R TaxID=3141542 RepID=UPI00315DB68C
MKTLLTSVAVLIISGTPFTKPVHNLRTKADSNRTSKFSALKLAEAKAFLSRANVRQDKIYPISADGGI